MSRDDLIWLAGLFEGEGCIHIARKGGPRGSVLLKVSMTDRDVIDRVAVLMGTHVTTKLRPAPYKTVFSARVSGDKAVALLADMYEQLGQRRQSKALEALAHFVTARAYHDNLLDMLPCLCVNGHPIRDQSDLYIYKRRSWCRACKLGRS